MEHGWQKRLEEARKCKRFSMRALCSKAGLGPKRYRHIVNSSQTIDLITIDKLAAALGVSPVWIAYGELGPHTPAWKTEEVIRRFWPSCSMPTGSGHEAHRLPELVD